MKKTMFSMALGAIILSSGCGLTSYSPDYPAAPDPHYIDSPQQARTDAKILGGLIVLNKNEIAGANEAERKSANPAVRNFAAWMHKEHSQNLHETELLSQRIGVQPVKGNLAMTLEKKGRHEMATLRPLNQRAFDRMYISAMVKDHTEALYLINHQLITIAANPLLKRQLEITSHHVSEHLQRAKAIQREMS